MIYNKMKKSTAKEKRNEMEKKGYMTGMYNKKGKKGYNVYAYKKKK